MTIVDRASVEFLVSDSYVLYLFQKEKFERAVYKLSCEQLLTFVKFLYPMCFLVKS